ncbi:hypothetical protein KR018_001299, partial [Drosophila ironensis]
ASRTSCPDGYDFDDETATCLSNASVACTNFQIMRCPGIVSVDQYCMCRDTRLEIRECPEGTYFDVNRSVCTIGTVECQDEYFTPLTCPNDPASNVFCLCIEGKYVTQECPAGYNFDADVKFCFPAKTEDPNVPSPGLDPESEKCGRLGLFADPADCSGYYICSDKGQDIQHANCPPGTVFSLTYFNCEAGTC